MSSDKHAAETRANQPVGFWMCPKCNTRTVNIYFHHESPDEAQFKCEACDYIADALSRPPDPAAPPAAGERESREGALCWLWGKHGRPGLLDEFGTYRTELNAYALAQTLSEYTAELRVQLAAAQNRSDLNAENVRLRELIYQCIREICYAQQAEHISQVGSEHGKMLIEQGIEVLGVKDLAEDTYARAALQKGS